MATKKLSVATNADLPASAPPVEPVVTVTVGDYAPATCTVGDVGAAR